MRNEAFTEATSRARTNRAVRFSSPRTTEKGISDVWKHVREHTEVLVPTRGVPAYRTRSLDPPQVGLHQAEATSRRRAPRSFFFFRSGKSSVAHWEPVRSRRGRQGRGNGNAR